MTTLENLKNNSNINWLLNNSEITYQDNDCNMTYFRGKLTTKMLSQLKTWFSQNGGTRCGGDVKVDFGDYFGSVSLETSKWKGDNTVTFTTCLAN